MKIFTQFKGLKKEIYIFAIGKLVTSLGSFVWPMITFFMTTKLGYSDSTAAMIIAIAGLLSLPASFVGGKLADKLNKKWIIIIFDAVSVLLYIIASFIEFSFLTIAIIFTASFFQNMEGPAYSALIADFSTCEQREKASTLEYVTMNLGFIAGSSISGLLFENHTRLAFILNGGAILISTILIFIFVDMKNTVIETQKEEVANTVYELPVEHKTSVFKILFDRKTVLIMMLVVTFSWVPANINSILLPLKLKSIHGASGATIYGYLSSFNGLTVICLTPLFTLLLAKQHEIPKMLNGVLLYGLGLAVFMATENTIILFVGMLIFTVGEINLVIGESAYTTRRIPLSHRGRVSGLSTIISTVIISLLELLISSMLEWTNSNYAFCYVAFVILSVVVFLVGFFTYKHDRLAFPLLYESKSGDKNEN